MDVNIVKVKRRRKRLSFEFWIAENGRCRARSIILICCKLGKRYLSKVPALPIFRYISGPGLDRSFSPSAQEALLFDK